jgi:multiple antibiotic resistance protein
MVIALAIYVCFAYSDRVERVLGNAGTDIVVRLTAFILFCLGIQIVWTGASEHLGTITSHKAAMIMIKSVQARRKS